MKVFTTVSPEGLVWSLPGWEEARLGQLAPLHVGQGPDHSARVVTANLDITVKLYSNTP